MKKVCLLVAILSFSLHSSFAQTSSTEALDSIQQLKKENKFEAALPLIDWYLKNSQKTDSTYANALVLFSEIYKALEMDAQAVPLLVKVNEIAAEMNGKNDPDYANSLFNLAELYHRLGRDQEAEPLYRESVTILKTTVGEASIDYASSLNSLAVYYHHQKKYRKSISIYKETIQSLEQIVGKSHPYYAISLSNLAAVYEDVKDYKEVEALYKESATILKKINGEVDFYYTASLNNLGFFYLNQERYEEAERLFLKIKEINTQLFPPYNEYVIANLNNLIRLYLAAEQPDKAYQYIFKAFALNIGQELDTTTKVKVIINQVVNANYSSRIHIVKTLKYFFQYYQKQQAYQEAQRIAEGALKVADNIRKSFSNEDDKLRELADLSLWIDRALSNAFLLKEKGAEVDLSSLFQYSEYNKSILLSDALKSYQSVQLGDLPDSLYQKRETLELERKQYEKLLLETPQEAKKDSIRSQLNSTNLKISTFQQQVKEQFPNYFRDNYAEIDVQIDAIQSQLTAKSSLLQYFVGDSAIFLFAISKEQAHFLQFPVSKNTLSEHTANLRKALSDYTYINENPEAEGQYLREAYWFYEQLLAPALKNQATEHLIIVPDGELGHLPFSAFLTASVTEENVNYSQLPYLLQKYRISYNYSTTLWLQTKEMVKSTAPKGQILALAASYKQDAQDSLQNRSIYRSPLLRNLRDALQELPAAQEEVKQLERQFKGAFWYGPEANEQQFKAQAGDYAVLHLAIHGLLNEKHPILSSLALTENGDSTEDNFLQAFEISQMQLQSQLVVLSACETGYGKFQQGEGVMSLARSFMYAGVPALVVSLWQVNDASTAKIMELFYEKLAEGQDKAAALQQAKLAYLELANGRAGHPAFWAPFVQLGDVSPVLLNKKQQVNPLWSIAKWGLLLVLLLTFIGLSYARWQVLTGKREG